MGGNILFAWVPRPHSPTITELIEDAYQKYKKLMFSTAKNYTQNISDQEDIVQTSLERLLKIFSNLDASKCCITAGYIVYVYTVRSVSIDLLRRKMREAKSFSNFQTSDILVDALGNAKPLDDLLVSLDHSDQLKALWSRVPEEVRILLEGKYIFELSDMELAILLGCKPSSIRMKLTRARRQAAKILLERDA